MNIPIQRVLHPADLFIARKALDSFQKNREELLLQISNTNYMMFEISFWDKDQWREDRDVPDGRMYYFGIANEQDPRECLNAIIAWLESEIERVEKVLVQFYEDGHKSSNTTITGIGVDRPKRHRIPIWYGYVLCCSLILFLINGYQVIERFNLMAGVVFAAASVIPVLALIAWSRRLSQPGHA